MKDNFNNWYRNTLRHPKYRWWIIGATIVYLISPLDISPDVFPVIGWIDDGIVATILVAELSQLLLERLKGRKENAAPQATNSTTTAEANVVDVDAVSLGQ